MKTGINHSATVEELRALAYAGVAEYPQYAAPYFDKWVRVRAVASQRTTGGQVMDADDVLLCRFGKIDSMLTRIDADQYVTVWTHHPRYCMGIRGAAVMVRKCDVREF